MPESTPGQRVVRLVRLRKGPLGAAFGLLFVLAAALPIAYGTLLGWSLTRAEGLADPAAWTVLIGAYLVAAGGGLLLHFVLYPDVELYTHGVQIRAAGAAHPAALDGDRPGARDTRPDPAPAGDAAHAPAPRPGPADPAPHARPRP